MKILAIKGRNLASIEGDFSIDFTVKPLVNVGIYAITGPTGSGKSTILDALCLALYGRTPRMKSAKENMVKVRDIKDNTLSQGDSRLIMRKGCADASAAVSFIGVDTYSYTATWSVKRAHNSVNGQMQDYNITLFNESANQSVPGKKTEVMKEIERLTGMTFDQFTRAVLLAQGDFTAFLKAEQNEKAELLEKLTGTEIYSRISTLIFQKAKDADQQVKALASRHSDIKLLEPEQAEAYNKQLKELKAEQQQWDDQKQLQQKAIDWFMVADRLQKELDEANLILQQTQRKLADSTEREARLLLVEQAQEARGLYQDKQKAADTLTDKKAALVNTQNTITELQVKIALSSQQQSEAEQHLTKVLHDYHDARPLLYKAGKLDAIIVSQKQPLVSSKADLEALQAKLQNQTDELNAKQEIIGQLSDSIDKLRTWIQQNEPRRPVAENATTIIARLEEAERDLRQINYHTRITDNAAAELEKTGQQVIKMESSVIELTHQLKPLKDTVLENEAALKKYDQDTAELDLTASITFQQELTTALTVWDKLSETRCSNDKTKKELALNEIKVTQTHQLFDGINSQIPLAEARKEQTEKILNDAKQRITGNIEQLRRELQPGEPCPVCGSTEHPYATAKALLQSEIRILEEEAKKCSEAWFELIGKKNTLNLELNHLEEEKQRLNIEAGVIENNLMSQSAQWEELSVSKNMAGIADHEITSMIKAQITENKIKTEELTRRNAEIRALVKSRETLNTDIALVMDETTHTREDLQKLKHSAELKKQELETARTTIASHKGNMDIIEKELSPRFNKPGWFETWASGPEVFLSGISKFAEQWVNITNECIKTEQSLLNHSTEAEGLRKNLEEKRQDIAARDKALNKLTLENEKLIQERATFFEGKEVSLVEKEYAEAELNARKASDEIKKQHNQLIEVLKMHEGVMQQLNGDIERTGRELQVKTASFSNWFIAFNNRNHLTAEESLLKEWLDLPVSWITQERDALKQLKDELLKAKATYNERKIQLTKHQAAKVSPATLEELQQEMVALNEEVERTAVVIADISVALKQDALNKVTAGGLLKEKEALEVISNRWQKLDLVLGSADGKKFRQVAQKYTLEVLLGYANKHLYDLSPRYSLECVPDSLALQVIDHDMGDEVRSVHYLSGGESFLVSLALALGLASLSSSRLKVESLFIDEGFGSLDPETLQTAMDALEKLHNDGRKVGVISHVQEMTERIPTQIRVIKLSGSRSKVEVSPLPLSLDYSPKDTSSVFTAYNITAGRGV